MKSDVGLGGDSHEIQGPVTIRLSLIEIWVGKLIIMNELGR